MMRMPDPSSDDAAARLDNANPRLHQTVGERIISGKNHFPIRLHNLFQHFVYFSSHISPFMSSGGPFLIPRAWEIA